MPIMESYDYDFASMARPRSVQLEAHEVEVLATLLRELRDVTLSRESYMAATDFLKRHAGETESPSLVSAEALAN